MIVIIAKIMLVLMVMLVLKLQVGIPVGEIVVRIKAAHRSPWTDNYNGMYHVHYDGRILHDHNVNWNSCGALRTLILEVIALTVYVI